ncbi:hypothetical protein BGX34_003154 [Mortierella sp. NVP85]|nr:hypothetical protein BGX34_003154 [Mortierella sp. NVP85]
MTTLAARTEQPVLHSEVVENPVEDPDTDSESDSEAGDDEYELDDEIIERATFEQLLQMDDDEDRNFSRGLVDDYFTQAEQTFEELDTAM